MPGKLAWMTIFSLMLCGSASAGNGFEVDYGHNGNRHKNHDSRQRSGAWAEHGRPEHGRRHGGGSHGHWGAAHDHFSPRGQGGHHWGW